MNLGAKAVAYLNVDCAVQGPGFFAGATPQLDDLIFEVTKKVDRREKQKRVNYMLFFTTGFVMFQMIFKLIPGEGP